MDHKNIIGRAEQVDFPDLELISVPAKIDTGADSSSIWVSSVQEKADGLHCIFFGPDSTYYTGKPVIFTDYAVTRVENSFGHAETRYKIKLRIRVKKRLIKGTFTLSDRSQKTYPVLLGRRLLRGKFMVDVASGQALRAAEKRKSALLQGQIKRSPASTSKGAQA